MDFNQVMADSIARANAVNNAGAAPMPMVPPLNTGTPVIDDSTYRQVIARALQQQFQPSPDDMNVARMKMFTALAQPRMPGESVAGNISTALNSGVTSAKEGRDRAQSLAMQQATMASNVSAQDAARRSHEVQMQMLQQKFPVEMAAAKVHYEQLVRGNELEKAQAFMKTFESNPEVVLQKFKTSQDQAGAVLGKTQAETEKAKADSQRALAEAEFLRNTGKAKEGVTVGADGMIYQHGVDSSGKAFVRQIIPGNPNATVQDAKAALEKEIKETTPGWHPMGYGLKSPTPEEIQQKLKELQMPRVVDMTGQGGAGATQGAIRTTAPTDEDAIKMAKQLDASGTPFEIKVIPPASGGTYTLGGQTVIKVPPIVPAAPSVPAPTNASTPQETPENISPQPTTPVGGFTTGGKITGTKNPNKIAYDNARVALAQARERKLNIKDPTEYARLQSEVVRLKAVLKGGE